MSATFASGTTVRRLAFALLTAGIPLLAFGQSGQWGSRGNSLRFAVRGNLVLVADGRGVAVYDVSQPVIRRLAFAETEAESIDLALVNDRDLAVATRTAVERFAIGDDGSLTPTSIDGNEVASRIASNGTDLAGITPIGITVWDAATHSIVTGFYLSPPPTDLAWHGKTLLAAEPGIGVMVYDLTGTRAPITLTENANDIAVAGDTLAIAAAANGLVLYDLSSAAPAVIARTGAGAVNFATVAVSSSRAFVTEQPNTIHVFDLASGMPVMTSTFNEPAQALAVSGTRLFVSGMLFDAFGSAANSGVPLRIFDTEDSSAPRVAGEFRDFAGPVSGVATDGTLAYVVDLPFFRVIDVSTTAAPRELASVRIDGFGNRVRTEGTRAIVFGRGDVQMIDISNPYAPRLMKVFHSNGGPPSGAAFARDTILEGNPYSGFHVVDFDNFAIPEQIGGLKGHYFDVAAEGDTAWIMFQGSSLMAVDLSDPRNARITSSTTVVGIRTEIAAATPRRHELLMVVSADGVHLFTASNPLAPRETSFIPIPSATAIAASGDRAFIASPGVIQSLDLLNPALQPTSMHAVAPMDIAAAAGKVVVADRYSLRVYGPDTPPPPPPAGRMRPSRR